MIMLIYDNRTQGLLGDVSEGLSCGHALYMPVRKNVYDACDRTCDRLT